MKLYLLLFSLVGVIHPVSGETTHWKAESSRTWPFLRGNVEFTLTHPLRIFHGRFEKMTGSVNLDPEDVNKGMKIQLEGNTRDITFLEPQAQKIMEWIGGGTAWKVESHSYIPRGGGEEGMKIEAIMNFAYSGTTAIQKLPANCQTDIQVLKCRFETKVLNFKVGLPIPKILGISSNNLIAARGEIVFGEKEEPK